MVRISFGCQFLFSLLNMVLPHGNMPCLGNQAQMLGLLWTLMPLPPIETDLISCYSHQLNCCPPLQWSNLNLQLTELLPHLMLLSPRPIQFPWSGDEVPDFQTSGRFFSLCPWPLWRRKAQGFLFSSDTILDGETANATDFRVSVVGKKEWRRCAAAQMDHEATCYINSTWGDSP